jgi:STE24 endopeptidase
VLGAAAAALGAIVVFLALTSPVLLRRAGVSSAGDPRALGLALLVVTLLGTIAGPALNLVSRRVEARADVHSLELTRDPQTFADSERRLALTNLSDLDPPPLVYLMFATHPTAPQRIALARDWAEANRVPVPPPLLEGRPPKPATPGSGSTPAPAASPAPGAARAGPAPGGPAGTGR